MSFMRWQAGRGLLNPLDASPPGSVWWRAVNERLLRDGCEAIALAGGRVGEPSSHAVRLWLEFIARPTGSNWYRAHNALGEARLLGLVRDGNPVYAWPFEQRHVWRSPHMPLAARLLKRATHSR
jgi:hypothetical protein